eukprot:gene34215-41415_t
MTLTVVSVRPASTKHSQQKEDRNTIVYKLALDEVSFLASHPGVNNLKQWMKEHAAPKEITADSANLRGVEYDVTTTANAAMPRFIYIGVYLGSSDCTGTLTSMIAYRFGLCQPAKAGSSYMLVYGGVENDQHVVNMQSFTNANCEGAPVFTSPMAGFSATCDRISTIRYSRSVVVDELPDMKAFIKNGFLSTVSNTKGTCEKEATRGKRIPAVNVREMVYAGLPTCVTLNGKDSMIESCSENKGGSVSFKVQQYESKDTTCSGPSQEVTTTTEDFCDSKRDTFIGVGYGYMNWRCNIFLVPISMGMQNVLVSSLAASTTPRSPRWGLGL